MRVARSAKAVVITNAVLSDKQALVQLGVEEQ